MIIVMKSTASKEDVEKVSGSVEKLGLRVNVVNGATQSVIGIIGDTTKVDPESIEVDPAVEKVMHVSEPYKLANRAFHPEDSVIDVGGVKIGGGHLAVIAGPCSVESKFFFKIKHLWHLLPVTFLSSLQGIMNQDSISLLTPPVYPVPF